MTEYVLTAFFIAWGSTLSTGGVCADLPTVDIKQNGVESRSENGLEAYRKYKANVTVDGVTSTFTTKRTFHYLKGDMDESTTYFFINGNRVHNAPRLDIFERNGLTNTINTRTIPQHCELPVENLLDS